MKTAVARGLLPEVVRHADAAANSGRAALLVAAMVGAPDLLLAATGDCCTRSTGARRCRRALDLVDALRGDGHAAVVSGAGPTVLALVPATDVDEPPVVRPAAGEPHARGRGRRRADLPGYHAARAVLLWRRATPDGPTVDRAPPSGAPS